MRFDCARRAPLQDCLFDPMRAVSAIDAAYRQFFKRYLFALDAEYAHRLTLWTLSLMPPFTPPRDLPELAINLWGTDFHNPIGLAAGMDKDAIAIPAWDTLRFRFSDFRPIPPRPPPRNHNPP